MSMFYHHHHHCYYHVISHQSCFLQTCFYQQFILFSVIFLTIHLPFEQRSDFNPLMGYKPRARLTRIVPMSNGKGADLRPVSLRGGTGMSPRDRNTGSKSTVERLASPGSGTGPHQQTPSFSVSYLRQVSLSATLNL